MFNENKLPGLLARGNLFSRTGYCSILQSFVLNTANEVQFQNIIWWKNDLKPKGNGKQTKYLFIVQYYKIDSKTDDVYDRGAQIMYVSWIGKWFYT